MRFFFFFFLVSTIRYRTRQEARTVTTVVSYHKTSVALYFFFFFWTLLGNCFLAQSRPFSEFVPFSSLRCVLSARVAFFFFGDALHLLLHRSSRKHCTVCFFLLRAAFFFLPRLRAERQAVDERLHISTEKKGTAVPLQRDKRKPEEGVATKGGRRLRHARSIRDCQSPRRRSRPLEA